MFWVARADGTPAPPGEPGRLQLTVLSNYVQPFVNYDIGDWGATAGAVPRAAAAGRPWLVSKGARARSSGRRPAASSRRFS